MLIKNVYTPLDARAVTKLQKKKIIYICRMKTLRITQKDYLKANRRASRQEEIDVHGKPVRISAVHKSKKKYDRKHEKAEFKKALPFLFPGSVFLKLPFVAGNITEERLSAAKTGTKVIVCTGSNCLLNEFFRVCDCISQFKASGQVSSYR
jgi:hypothetical protein